MSITDTVHGRDVYAYLQAWGNSEGNDANKHVYLWLSFSYLSNQDCILQSQFYVGNTHTDIHMNLEKNLTKKLKKTFSQSEDLPTEHMPVVKSPRVQHSVGVWQCVCARVFIFALQLTPQVMVHTASAHQTLRVRPIFYPFDFVESFVRCHHGDLNKLCQLLYWQHHFSSSCLYFPTITSLSVYSLFSPWSVLISLSVILTVPSLHIVRFTSDTSESSLIIIVHFHSRASIY